MEAPPKKNKNNMFVIAIKSIAFAWQTDRGMVILLIVLNLFQGAIVYLQFGAFSRIVDQIMGIKQHTNTIEDLIQTSVVLGLSFLVPTLVGVFASYSRVKFQAQQNTHLEMYKIERQSALDISTIESTSYQNLLHSAQEWGTGSISNMQDFIFTSAT